MTSPSLRKPLLMLILALLATVVSVFASSACFQPRVVFEGNENWTYSNTATDRNGNVFHSGTFIGTVTVGGYSLTSVGGRDVFVIKYDSCGIPQWAVQAGSAGNEDNNSYGKGMATDSYGNLYWVGGYNATCTVYGTNSTVFSAGYNATSNPNHQDAFIVKMNPDGEVLWGASLQGVSNESATGVTVDPLDNPIMIAGFNGCCPSGFAATVVAPFNSLNLYSYGANYGTGAVIKFDETGNALWWAGIFNRDASCSGVVADSIGNIYVVGAFRSWAKGTPADVLDSQGSTYTISNPGIGLGYLFKLDAAGGWQWGVPIGNAGDGVGSLTQVMDVTLDDQGKPWMTGYFSGDACVFNGVTGGALSLPPAAFNVSFVAGYSVTGNPLFVNPMQVDPNNHTYLYGLSKNGSAVVAVGTFEGPTAGGTDIVTASYDLTGVPIGTSVSGGPGDDKAWCIRPFGSDFMVSGGVASGGIVDGLVAGTDACFLWNMDHPLTSGIHDSPHQSVSMGIYPNPSSGRFHLSQSLPNGNRYRVLDALGRTVDTGAMPSSNSFDFSFLSPGIYTLFVEPNFYGVFSLTH